MAKIPKTPKPITANNNKAAIKPFSKKTGKQNGLNPMNRRTK